MRLAAKLVKGKLEYVYFYLSNEIHSQVAKLIEVTEDSEHEHSLNWATLFEYIPGQYINILILLNHFKPRTFMDKFAYAVTLRGLSIMKILQFFSLARTTIIIFPSYRIKHFAITLSFILFGVILIYFIQLAI